MRGAAFFLSLLVLVGCDSSGSLSDQDYLARAQEFLDQGEFRAASIELKNALRQNLSNPQTRWLLGTTYVELGDGPAAEKELRRAQKLGVVEKALIVPLGKSLLLQGKHAQLLEEIQPQRTLPAVDRAEIRILRGNAYLGEGALDRARKEFQVALDMDGHSAPAKAGLARLAIMDRKFEKARAWVDQALLDEPEFAQAWSLLGDLEALSNDPKAAEAAYGKAVTYEPNSTRVLLKRATVRISLADYEGAAQDIDLLSKRAPRHPAIAYAKGLLHFRQQQYAEAQADFEEVLGLTPNDMRAIFYLGATHAAQRHVEQGKRHLSRFLSSFPESSQAAKILGALLIQGGDYTGAEAVLNPILLRDPNDTVALNLLGRAALPQGKSKQSIDYFRRVIAQQTDSAKTHLQLGLGLLMEEEYEQGIQELSTAKKIKPDLRQADYLTIMGYLKSGQIDKAIAAAQQLREKQPDSPHPLTLMAGAYLTKGDEPKARELLHQALRVAPGDPSAAANLARLELRKGNLTETRSLYEQILKHHPAHMGTLLALAQLDARQGDIKGAITRLEYTVEEHPNAIVPRVRLAAHYLRTGKPSRVLNIVRDAPEANTNPFLVGVTGEAQLALGEAASAKTTFKRLIELAPESARPHYLLAKASGALNQPDAVYKQLGKALEIKPDYLPAKLAMARLYLQDKRSQDAEKLIAELNQAHSSHPEVLTLVGTLALQQHRPTRAIAAYGKAAALAPSAQRTILLATAQWQAGDRDSGIATYKKWLREHPSDAAIQLHLANAYLLLDRAEEAKKAFTRAVELAPNNVLAWNNLAWLTRTDDPAKALKYAEQALKLAPNNPLVMDTLGELLLGQGEVQRALQLFRDASSAAPDNPDIRYHLALALVRSEHQAEARQILKQILEKQGPFANKQAAEALLESLGG